MQYLFPFPKRHMFRRGCLDRSVLSHFSVPALIYDGCSCLPLSLSALKEHCCKILSSAFLVINFGSTRTQKDTPHPLYTHIIMLLETITNPYLLHPIPFLFFYCLSPSLCLLLSIVSSMRTLIWCYAHTHTLWFLCFPLSVH